MTSRVQFPVLAIACAAFAIAAAAPAMAGEVNGRGDKIPGAVNGASICAFSGLNDHPEGAPGNFPGKVQNFGAFKLFFQNLFDMMFNPHELPFYPGDSCQGNLDEPPPE